MNDFLGGFISGAKDTPKGFFAPVVAVWMLLLNVTNSLVQSQHKNDSSVAGKRQ